MYIGFGRIVFQNFCSENCCSSFLRHFAPIYETIQFHTAEEGVLNTHSEKLTNS